jgi:hypothetical protein
MLTLDCCARATHIIVLQVRYTNYACVGNLPHGGMRCLIHALAVAIFDLVLRTWQQQKIMRSQERETEDYYVLSCIMQQ